MVKNQKRNLFREAVKPTEEGGAFDPAKAAQKRQELLRQRGAEVKSQATQQPSSPPAPNTSSATSKPSPIVGRADPSTSQGQAAIATNQQQIQQNAQATQQARANQSAASAASLQNLQGGGRTQPSAPQQPAQASAPQQPAQNQTSQQDAASFFDNMAAQAGFGSSASQSAPLPAGSSSTTQSSNNDGEEVEISTTQQTVTQEPLVTDDSGQSYTYDEIKSMIDNLKTQSVPASDQEMSEDEEVDLSKIQENKNIAYFLKCLSEKNYSNANKYMCKIVESKFKSKLKKVIK
jgi:hypothetical protein